MTTAPTVLVGQLVPDDPTSWAASCCESGCNWKSDTGTRGDAVLASELHATYHQETAVTVMATEPITAGFYDNIPEATYHADRTSLSVSGAKLLLKAPALYKHQLDHPARSDAFDFGTAAHALVLNVGAPIEVVEADDWRTKAAQEAKAAARAEGKTPLLAKDYRKVIDMADVLSSHTLAMTLLDPTKGRGEVSAYCPDEETGVMRRGRFDWLSDNILTDYKTCASANPRDWAGKYGVIRKYGYDAQAIWYLDLARDLGHDATAWVWIAQEKEPPYLVTVIEADESELVEARERNRLALQMFRDCTETGIWPGYVGHKSSAKVGLNQPEWFEQVVL